MDGFVQSYADSSVATFWEPGGGARRPLVERIILVSADDTLVLVVECTVQQPGTEKLSRLAARTKALADALETQFGENTPCVRGVFAIQPPRAQLAPGISDWANRNWVPVLCGDELVAILELLERGASQAELEEHLGEPLALAFVTQRQPRIW